MLTGSSERILNTSRYTGGNDRYMQRLLILGLEMRHSVAGYNHSTRRQRRLSRERGRVTAVAVAGYV